MQRKELAPMALMRCPECQHEVSTRAASCPHCGYPIHPQRQPPSWHDDPDLVRLVERERWARESAPIIIVTLLVADLILFCIALATGTIPLVISTVISFFFFCIMLGASQRNA
jgi:ribosomal protein L37E